MSVFTVLGIESSCDETAAAIVRLTGEWCTVLSDVVAGQVDDHARFGGVVPEVAARAHAEKADAVVAATMKAANLEFNDLDGVAATAGPGLIGGVMVGLVTAKAIALAKGLPLIGVNHLEGHALSPRLSEHCPFPYLLLLVSGGHCQFLHVKGLGNYERLGTTIDDAAGEAFDKTAKLLSLGFPGGPAVEAMAKSGDPGAVRLPRPLLDRPGLDMSFAGLKTAVRQAAAAEPLTDARVADLCASFQRAVTDVLTTRARAAMAKLFHTFPVGGHRFVVAGGVAANATIRAELEAACEAEGYAFLAPPLKWCTDNGAMIALAGAERLRDGFTSPLDLAARPRWPLDEAAAASNPAYGGGKKGAKV